MRPAEIAVGTVRSDVGINRRQQLQSGAVVVRIRNNVVTAVQKGLTRLECPAAGEKVIVFNANAWANACNWTTEPKQGNAAEIVTVLTPEKAAFDLDPKGAGYEKAVLKKQQDKICSCRVPLILRISLRRLRTDD